jgi:PAS domain-containing protein
LVRGVCAVILLTGIATALRAVLDPILGSRTPFLFHLLAVAVAAQVEGTAAAFTVAGLSLFLINWLFIPPIGDPFSLPSAPADQAALALFALTAACLCTFGGRQRKIQAELRHTRDCLALRQEAARIASFEWYPQENRVEWSPEMMRLYGFEPDGCRSPGEWRAKLIHQEDLPSVTAVIDRAARERRPTLDMTYRLRAVENGTVWIHSRSRWEYDARGRPERVVAVLLDVTDLKVARAPSLRACLRSTAGLQAARRAPGRRSRRLPGGEPLRHGRDTRNPAGSCSARTPTRP